jgi:putative methionine-R-sulfoxide reductase with GAF domain
VPVLDRSGGVRAVLDVDSDALAAFDEADPRHLEKVCRWVP